MEAVMDPNEKCPTGSDTNKDSTAIKPDPRLFNNLEEGFKPDPRLLNEILKSQTPSK